MKTSRLTCLRYTFGERSIGSSNRDRNKKEKERKDGKKKDDSLKEQVKNYIVIFMRIYLQNPGSVLIKISINLIQK